MLWPHLARASDPEHGQAITTLTYPRTRRSRVTGSRRVTSKDSAMVVLVFARQKASVAAVKIDISSERGGVAVEEESKVDRSSSLG